MATAGGDGTFMYLADDAHKAGIMLNEYSHIQFCVLPFGTGNDTSQVLGWGAQPKPIWTQSLQILAQQIIDA